VVWAGDSRGQVPVELFVLSSRSEEQVEENRRGGKGEGDDGEEPRSFKIGFHSSPVPLCWLSRRTAATRKERDGPSRDEKVERRDEMEEENGETTMKGKKSVLLKAGLRSASSLSAPSHGQEERTAEPLVVFQRQTDLFSLFRLSIIACSKAKLSVRNGGRKRKSEGDVQLLALEEES
jgi:hypothetical protein